MVIFDTKVMICSECGCGMLTAQPRGVHPVPKWFTSFSSSEGVCFGTIKVTDRRQQIARLDQMELINDKT